MADLSSPLQAHDGLMNGKTDPVAGAHDLVEFETPLPT